MKRIKSLGIGAGALFLALPVYAQPSWNLGLKAGSTHFRMAETSSARIASSSKEPVHALALMLEARRQAYPRISWAMAVGTGLTGVGKGPVLQLELDGMYYLGRLNRPAPFVQVGLVGSVMDFGGEREGVWGFGPMVSSGFRVPMSATGKLLVGMGLGHTIYRPVSNITYSPKPVDDSGYWHVSRVTRHPAWQLRPFVTVVGALKRN